MKIKTRTTVQNNKRKGTNNSANNNRNNPNPYMVVPYYKGLSESLKTACSKHGAQVYFKGDITIKNLLVAPKDKDPILRKSGVIYRYKCDRVECDEEYIGEWSRTFGERFKEHQKATSPICDHHNITGHNISIDSLCIVVREDQNLIRTIKEALYIRVNSHPKQKYRQIPSTIHMGWGSVKQLRTQIKIKINRPLWLCHLPLWY